MAKIKDELQRLGYQLDIKLLNTKDFGIPQNRLRAWIYGYLGVRRPVVSIISVSLMVVVWSVTLAYNGFVLGVRAGFQGTKLSTQH